MYILIGVQLFAALVMLILIERVIRASDINDKEDI